MEGEDKVLHKDLSFKLIGVLFATHNEINRFSKEKEVCDTIEKYLKEKNIQYERELKIEEKENSNIVRKRIDFLIDEKIILKVKCKNYLKKEDYYQVQRYLHAMNYSLGILVNFREERLHPKRILNSSGSVN